MTEDYYGYVYKTKNKINEKVYIGKKTGEYDANYYGSGSYICSEVKKLGKEMFDVTVLDYAKSKDELDKKEQHYIYQYSSQDPKIGYNIADGGSHSSNTYRGESLIEDKENIIMVDGVRYKKNTIYYSSNYSMFKRVTGNREVSSSPNLVNSIKAFGVIQPIVINERFQIVDGQHRFEILKQLGYDIKFIMIYTGDYTEEVMKDMNLTQKKWSKLDFINYYAELNNDNYVVLKQLIEEYSSRPYKLSMGVIEMVASGQYELGYNSSHDVKSGEFKIHSKKGIDHFMRCFKRLVDESGIERQRRELLIPFHSLISYKNFDIDHFISNSRRENFSAVKRGMYNTNRFEVFGELIKVYNSSLMKKQELNVELKIVDGLAVMSPHTQSLDSSLVKIR